MKQEHGSTWTRPEYDAIKVGVDRGLSPQRIALQLRSSGSERTLIAIKSYYTRVRLGKVQRPPDADELAWRRGEAVPSTGALDSRIENVAPPIYQPDAPNPPPAPIVPDGEGRVGVIGDTHIPFCLPGYLDFCRETFQKWGVNSFVHIGDLLDNHAISFHKPDPDGRSAGDEYRSAIDALGPWYRAFPHLKWITGNHDALPQRKVYDAGLPANMIRGNYYQAPPGWSNAESFEVDGVLYTHGIGCGGINGHRILAQKRGVSCVIGHIHMTAGVAYTSAHDGEQRFGLAVGCGVDHKSYAMAYARYFGRPALGCGVVLGGKEAHFIPMLKGRTK